MNTNVVGRIDMQEINGIPKKVIETLLQTVADIKGEEIGVKITLEELKEREETKDG